MTWHHTSGPLTCYGWAVPDLNPTTDSAYNTHGCFIDTYAGDLWGMGTMAVAELPEGYVPPDGRSVIPEGATLSLRYHPTQGTMHARVNKGTERLCFTDLRNDLVPAVCLVGEGDSCSIVVRLTHQLC